MVLPWASPQQALNMGEKIRQAIVSLHIPHQDSKSGHPFLTISVGAASLIPQPQQTPKDLLEMADQALYQAKHQGRNQVVMAP